MWSVHRADHIVPHLFGPYTGGGVGWVIMRNTSQFLPCRHAVAPPCTPRFSCKGMNSDRILSSLCYCCCCAKGNLFLFFWGANLMKSFTNVLAWKSCCFLDQKALLRRDRRVMVASRRCGIGKVVSFWPVSAREGTIKWTCLVFGDRFRERFRWVEHATKACRNRLAFGVFIECPDQIKYILENFPIGINWNLLKHSNFCSFVTVWSDLNVLGSAEHVRNLYRLSIGCW